MSFSSYADYLVSYFENIKPTLSEFEAQNSSKSDFDSFFASFFRKNS